MRYNIFILLLIIIGFIKIEFLSAQIIYLSPVPNSSHNNPETNIIIKFDDELLCENKINELIEIRDGINKIYSFKSKLVNNNKTLLIFPDNEFIEDNYITIEIKDSLLLKKNKVSPFKFSFYTSKKASNKIQNLDQEDAINYDENVYASENFPPITVEINDNPSPGKIFFYNISALASDNDRFMAIIDNNGNPVFKKLEVNKGLSFTLQPSGYMSFWNDGNFAIMDSSYNIVKTIGCKNGYHTDFHEFINLKDGHSFVVSWDVEIIDMSKIVDGGCTAAHVAGLIIQELDENQDVVFQWRSWDYYKITDAIDKDFTEQHIDYVHGNGISICDDGNILLSARVLNEITKIDRVTGEIIWRLGGKNNQFTVINDDEMFCRQHHIQYVGNNHITLFDNGVCHDPPVSSVKEYLIDEENMIAELVWKYVHPKNIYSSTMGSVQRLENGNTFICWGGIESPEFPTITEVRPDKTIAFELYFDKYFHVLYRSFRYNWDNKVTTANEHLIDKFDIMLFPNPVANNLFVEIPGEINETKDVLIYDLFGKKVLHINNSERNRKTFNVDISTLNNGMYIIQFIGAKKTVVKKFLVNH